MMKLWCIDPDLEEFVSQLPRSKILSSDGNVLVSQLTNQQEGKNSDEKACIINSRFLERSKHCKCRFLNGIIARTALNERKFWRNRKEPLLGSR